MHVGVLDSVLKQPWDTLYGSAAALGLDGVELGVFDQYASSALWNSQGRAQLRKHSARTGVVTCSVCVHTFWLHSFAHPDESERSLARQICLEAIAAASGVGARNILVPLTNPKGVAGLEEARDRWAEGICTCAPSAAKAGVVLCLENVNQAFANRAKDIAVLVDAIASPAVRVYFDAANAVKSGLDPVREIGVLGQRIAQVHVKEFGGALLGEGTVPWADVIPALRGVGYGGWLVFETASTDDPMDAARKNAAHLSSILAA